jgi:hypothetical protein
MPIRESFSASTWCSGKLASRSGMRIYVSVLAVMIVTALGLRIEAALFERRAFATVRALSTLRVGVTSKAEAVARMQAVGPMTGPYGAPLCLADECLWTGIRNSRLSDAVFLPVTRTENRALYSLLTWWGFRYWSLSADVSFASGKVSRLSYRLGLSNSHFDGALNAVIVEVGSQDKIIGMNRGATPAEDVTYRVTPSNEWPDKSVRIAFKPNASGELVNSAFDLNLHCISSLAGCNTWSQILPQVRR